MLTVEPLVDVSIAVHTAARPIARAVGSVVDRTQAPVRVNVIAHNIDAAVIRANLGSYAQHPAVRLLELRDGIGSPAGPLNLGLAESSAPFLSVMGSDDELEAGAIDSWLSLQKASDAAMVIARIREVGGGVVKSPPVRPFRRRGLDPVKDRLAYRSAPLGLISREQFGDLRFAEGLPSGEDLPYVTAVWFSGRSLAFDRSGPAYLVHPDAPDRVTSDPRPIADDFAFLDRVFEVARQDGFDRQARNAIAVKLLRTHVFDAVLNRSAVEWSAVDRAALASVVERILEWGGRPELQLSRIDRRLLDLILEPSSPVSELIAELPRRWRYTTPAAAIPRNPLRALQRQAPLRTLAAGYLVR